MALWQEAACWIICSSRRETLTKTDRVDTNPTSRVKKAWKPPKSHGDDGCRLSSMKMAEGTFDYRTNFFSKLQIGIKSDTRGLWSHSNFQEPQQWHGHWKVPGDWTLWPLFSCHSGWGSCLYRLLLWGLMSVSAEQSEESTENSWCIYTSYIYIYIYDEYWWKGLLNQWFSLRHGFVVTFFI